MSAGQGVAYFFFLYIKFDRNVSWKKSKHAAMYFEYIKHLETDITKKKNKFGTVYKNDKIINDAKKKKITLKLFFN
jgi:hypothetical protein